MGQDEIGNETGAGDLCEPGPQVDDLEAMRVVARQEVASLCGLVLRRLQDAGTANPLGEGFMLATLSRIFGEALADFGGSESEPGE
jgi:hypothetical protein